MAVAIVSIEGQGCRLFVFRHVTGPISRIDEKQILAAVVVVIEEGHAATHGLGQEFVSISAVVVNECYPGCRGDIRKFGDGNVLRSSGARQHQPADDWDQLGYDLEFVAHPMRHRLYMPVVSGNITLGAIVKNRWGKWLLGLGFWTLLGLSFASQFYISSAKAGLDVTWKLAVGYALGDWYVFALLSIPVIPIAHRFRFESGSRLRSLLVHAAASALFSLAYMVLRAWVGQWQSTGSFEDAFKPLLVKTWHFNWLIYWVIVAVSQAFDYYRRFRERELRASELEKRLVEAKLQALQMQLNPHFLFNTLHSISSLMHQNVEAADRMVSRLAELLRAALEGSDTQEVALREELDFLKRYLEIEQIWFGSRLAVLMSIAPDNLECPSAQPHITATRGERHTPRY